MHFVASGDATGLLEFTEETLDCTAITVENCAEDEARVAIAPGFLSYRPASLIDEFHLQGVEEVSINELSWRQPL